MLGITSMWTYRNELQKTRFGLSLEAYSANKRKWVHIAYFEPAKIEQAKAEYEKVMRWHAQTPKHLDFSFNNLIEIEQMLLGEEGGSMNTDDYVEMLNMITEISHILQIRLEVGL